MMLDALKYLIRRLKSHLCAQHHTKKKTDPLMPWDPPIGCGSIARKKNTVLGLCAARGRLLYTTTNSPLYPRLTLQTRGSAKRLHF